MKIALISDFFYPELSGVADAVALLGSTLVDRGHEVLYIIPRYPKPHTGTYRTKSLPSIPFVGSPTGQGRLPLPFGVGIKALWDFKPDVIHTHSPYVPGLEALLYAKLTKTPIVGTHHTILSEFMKGSPAWVIKAALHYNSWYYSRCAFVSAPSQVLINEMVEYGLDTDYEAMSNPIDVAHFSRAQSDIHNSTILYAGRLSEDKHVEVIIQSLPKVREKIPDIRLLIAGRGAAEPALRALAKKLSVEKNVEFLGFVPKENLPETYKECSLFVIMSTSESQSLVLMQAMAAGKPVIGADSRALPEYITHDVGRVVEPGNDAELADEIIAILSDPTKAREMGAAGIAKVANYLPQEIADRWQNIYTHAINHKHGKK